MSSGENPNGNLGVAGPDHGSISAPSSHARLATNQHRIRTSSDNLSAVTPAALFQKKLDAKAVERLMAGF